MTYVIIKSLNGYNGTADLTIQRFNGFLPRPYFDSQHFHTQIIQYHWREDQARDAHEPLAKDQRNQGQPHWVSNPVSDDLAV
jgi:hypothetical protein